MSIAFFNYYISAILEIPFVYIIPNIHNLTKKKTIVGIFSIMAASGIVAFCATEYATYLSFVLSLLIIYLISINKLSAIIFSCFNYICYIENDYILLTVFDILFDISEVELLSNNTYIILYNLFHICIFITVSVILSKLHLKFLSSGISSHGKTIAFMAVFVITCLALFLFNITYEAEKGFSQELVTYNSIIFSLFFILTAVFLVIFVRLILQNERLNYQNLQYQSLQDYTKKTEGLYNDMRKFKHEYLNKLLTMHFYISDGDIDSLKEYYKTNILPTKKELESNFQTFADLANILVPEFKGLVYNKLLRAQELGIDIRIEIKKEINSLSPYKTEITKLVGIYLDNAIDETVPNETHPKNHISFIAFFDDNKLTITVSNDITSQDINITKLDKVGFSSKGENRGLGLYIAKNLLEKCPDITHNTYIKDNIFYQTLTLVIQGGN